MKFLGGPYSDDDDDSLWIAYNNGILGLTWASVTADERTVFCSPFRGTSERSHARRFVAWVRIRFAPSCLPLKSMCLPSPSPLLCSPPFPLSVSLFHPFIFPISTPVFLYSLLFLPSLHPTFPYSLFPLPPFSVLYPCPSTFLPPAPPPLPSTLLLSPIVTSSSHPPPSHARIQV